MNYPEFLAGAKCCVCGNEKPERFSVRYEKNNLHVIECNDCSFTFIPPFYRKQIRYENYKDEAVTQAIRSGNNWLKIQRHKLRFKLIKKYKKNGSLFDLGAGWGHFMLAGQQLGYDVYGIEISEQNYLYSKNDLNLPVDKMDFFDMKEEKKFDIVTLWDVLEHIDDANPFVAKCAAVTKPGGILVLQVPQIDSYIAKRKKEKWLMMGLDHVNYFSKKTIRQILSQHGFEVIKIKSSIELKLFLLYSVFPKKLKKKNPESTQPVSSAQRQEYFNKVTKRPMWQLKIFVFFHNIAYRMLSCMRIGEEMIVVARRK